MITDNNGPHSEAEREVDAQLGVWRVERALAEARRATASEAAANRREAREALFRQEFGVRAPGVRKRKANR